MHPSQERRRVGGRSPLTRSAAPLLAAATVALTGCAGGGAGTSPTTAAGSVPAYVTEPFTRQEQLVNQGARLVIADGCSSCHLMAHGERLGPSFDSFAGHRVTLADGRRVLVDESFLRKVLLDPQVEPLRGYPAAPMIAALAPLHLARHPREVTALAAFIEQIGPEPE